MDWIKTHKSLAGIAGFFLAIALVIGVMLFLGWSGYEESRTSFDKMVKTVKALEGASLYPNEANLNAYAEKVGAYETALVGDAEKKIPGLSDVLLKLQAPVEDITDTAFQQKLKLRIKETKETATNTKLPKDFAFGFDTYTVSLPRSPEAAKEVNDFFVSVDSIISKAIEAGTTSIDSIQRTELSIEKGEKPAPPPEPAAKSKGKAKDKGKDKGKTKAVAKPVTRVVERRQLTLSMTMDQRPLQVLLNALATPDQMPYYTIVRNLRVENEKQDGPMRSAVFTDEKDAPAERPHAAPTTQDGQPAAPVVRSIAAPKPEKADTHIVIGTEKLKVYMEIDIVRFLPPGGETAGAQ